MNSNQYLWTLMLLVVSSLLPNLWVYASVESTAIANNNFRAVMQHNRPPSQPRPPSTISNQGQAHIPLAHYEQVRQEIRTAQKTAKQSMAPAVILGASSYTGEARKGGVLAFHLTLGVTLGQPKRWKVVPLAGEEVVLVKAHSGDQPLSLSRMNGYHVWITQQTGEHTLELEILIPSKGPRGSMEYDFQVARTPVTHFQCRFPMADLEPRLDAAVQTRIEADGAETVLTATLQPTTRIHLVGFRDLGEETGRPARIYAESLNLLSVDEGNLDLFTVLRYNILYAGAKSFEILIPPGMAVVSADGQGAFRYTLEVQGDNSTLLRGETAFRIRNRYEISLRLRKEISGNDQAFDVVLPQSQKVEREYGWLAVEVTGNLRLVEQQRQDALAVDVRQLPWEMMQSSVSPILKAYRYHSSQARIRLSATQLPSMEPVSASVDRIKADTVVSTEGRILTDLRITLRNRLRPNLGLQLPEGMAVRSALLDEEPVKPSRRRDGTLLFPLKRSQGTDRLKAFSLQVVLESNTDPMTSVGITAFQLPKLELPVSELEWNLYLPPRNLYSDLTGDIEDQAYVGAARWYRPAVGRQIRTTINSIPDLQVLGGGETGAMPVRIALPRSGELYYYNRYWLAPEQPIKISIRYLRYGLYPPLILLAMGILVVGIGLFGKRFTPTALRRHWSSWLGLAVLIAIAWIIGQVSGAVILGWTGLLGVLLLGWQYNAYRQIQQAGSRWFRSKSKKPESWTRRGRLHRLSLVIAWGVVGVFVASALLQLASQLFYPLPG